MWNTMVSVRDKVSMGGNRHVWHTLRMKGIGVPRSTVQALLTEFDPKGTEERRAHSLRRRAYRTIGPNYR